jgi:uncharacterized protein (TIGR02246 family)
MSANQGTSTGIDVSGIDRLRDAHVASLNAGDGEGWAACFTDDAVQMPPHFGANAGIAAIRGWSKGFLSMFGCRFSLSVEEVQAAGSWAFECGRYDITLTPKAGGGPLVDNGKYITIYQRQSDGSWKIARDIWNSDQPLPGMR